MTHRETAQSVLFPPFDSCPGCGATGLLPQPAGDQAIFHCAACRSYWHVDLGWMHLVGPAKYQSRAPAASSARPDPPAPEEPAQEEPAQELLEAAVSSVLTAGA